MKNKNTHTVLQTNATPVYDFLSFIHTKQAQGTLGANLKILDCGAGGNVPPLALFSDYGFETYGIDVSDVQLERAGSYAAQHGLKIDLRKADMRKLPFTDQYFDCVYEHYSMCHLSKQDTDIAISEMFRVLKKNGLCFLGVISMDSMPKSLYGEEKDPGEFWDQGARHSMFTDQEADHLVHKWEILLKSKRVRYLHDTARKISKNEWMKMYNSQHAHCSEDEWLKRFDRRTNMVNYTHIYYILKK